MNQHPLSACFPLMAEDEFVALKRAVEDNGQREPVIVLDSMVLDGWHRYRACTDLGLPVKKFTFDSNGDPVAFVKSVHRHRRHMSGSQRAAAAEKLAEWFPAHRPNKGAPGSPLSKTNAELAKEAQVSVRTIKDAKAAEKAGLGTRSKTAQ